jgi:uncharacterized membrane protein HdeD (DUF308 family)
VFLKVTVRVLLGIMIIMNFFIISFHNPLLLGISLALGGIIIILDLYQEFTRKKIITYLVGVVLVTVLYVAIGQSWITALTFI